MSNKIIAVFSKNTGRPEFFWDLFTSSSEVCEYLNTYLGTMYLGTASSEEEAIEWVDAEQAASDEVYNALDAQEAERIIENQRRLQGLDN